MRVIYTLLISFLVSLTSAIIAQQEFVVQTGHSSEVNKVEFSSNGDIFATAGHDNNIVLWEFSTGKQIRLIHGHRDHINDLKFIKGDSVLLSCSNDSSIVMWDTYSGKKISSFTTTFLPKSIDYNVISNDIYIAAKILYQYNLNERKLNTLKTPKRSPFTIVKCLDDGSVIFGGERRGSFFHKIGEKEYKHRGSIQDLAFNEEQTIMTVIGKSGTINQYTLGKKGFHYSKTLRSSYLYGEESFAIDHVRDQLVTLGRGNDATLVDTKTGASRNFYISNYYEALDIAIHPWGKSFITVANDGIIYLWDIATGELIRDFKSNSSAINFAKFTIDKKAIVIGYNSGLIRYWDLNYGGALKSHKFRLSNKQIKKGWKYSVLSLEGQQGDLLSFKVVLTKPYPGISYYKECRFIDFKWNLKTNQKSLTETETLNYDPFETNFEDVVEKSNRKFQNDSLFIQSEGTRVTEFRNDKPKDVGFESPHSNVITSVDYDPWKQIYITSSWDGQILMYNNKQKVIARLITLGTDDFVIISKDQYYYATKGALKYVGFTEGLASTSFEQYDLFFNRPEIVYKDFPYGDESNLNYLETIHNKRLARANSDGSINKNSEAPNISITSMSGLVCENSLAKVKISVSDNYGINDFNIRIDGVPIFHSKHYHINKKSIDTTLNISLQEGMNKITFGASNIKNVLASNQTIYIKSTEKMPKPNLYFVGIGASQYQDTTKNLRYAQKDIKDILKVFKKSKLFKSKNFLTFYNQQIVKDSLSKIDVFLASANVNDVVIMYYAGHGLLNKNLEYFLASHDNDFYAPEEKALPYNWMEEKLKKCESRKKLFFLDACHSGELDIENTTIKDSDIEIGKEIKFRNASPISVSVKDKGSLEALKMLFADLKDHNGITVISSAGGADYAIESDQWANGAFTHCLIKGLKSGDSDLDNNGVITISDMLQYLQINVPLITNGYQVPTFRSENIENDFIIWRR